MDKNKLKNILDKMNSDSGLGKAFKSVEDEMRRVSAKMKRDAESQATDFAKKSVQELKAEIQTVLEDLVKAFKTLQGELGVTENKLTASIEEKINSLRTASAQFRIADSQGVKTLAKEIETLRADITEIGSRKVKIPDFGKDIEKLRADCEKMMQQDEVEDNGEVEGLQKQLDKLEKEFTELRSRTLTALSSGHGGNANRNILVNSNSSTLSRYTDLNFKPGANITLSYVNNDNLKTTDLTIAATGGGGGTSRSINTVSVSSVLVATASTDIVVIASAGIQLTMPTAVGNNNLYTIKNTSTSSVLVNTTGGQTIDGSTTAIMPVQYTSIDLISDNSNWQIT